MPTQNVANDALAANDVLNSALAAYNAAQAAYNAALAEYNAALAAYNAAVAARTVAIAEYNAAGVAAEAAYNAARDAALVEYKAAQAAQAAQAANSTLQAVKAAANIDQAASTAYNAAYNDVDPYTTDTAAKAAAQAEFDAAILNIVVSNSTAKALYAESISTIATVFQTRYDAAIATADAAYNASIASAQNARNAADTAVQVAYNNVLAAAAALAAAQAEYNAAQAEYNAAPAPVGDVNPDLPVGTVAPAPVAPVAPVAPAPGGNGVPICFNEGTKILCFNKNLQEEYISIENLKKGDLVKTYKHGYRRIDLIGKNVMVNNPDNSKKCMYKMVKTDKNCLLEDLIITGGHSILVDDPILLGKTKKIHKVDDKYLLLSSISKDFIKLTNNNLYTYWHLTLESDDDNQRFGIWANGLLTETTYKNSFIKHNFIGEFSGDRNIVSIVSEEKGKRHKRKFNIIPMLNLLKHLSHKR